MVRWRLDTPVTASAIAPPPVSRVSRLTRSLLSLGAIAVCAILGFALFTLPPAPVLLDVQVPPTTVFGGYHIHTVHSDGSGTPAEVAEAAARAGLSFVILTDHGDATRPPDPAHYHAGVLVIDAVEISTAEGHLVALGLEAAAPYPLRGEARDIIEDVTRLGGWSIAAHPDSQKPDLRWRGPVTSGVEWLNADSEWRDDAPSRVLTAALHALVRPAPAVAGLFGAGTASLRRWDQWGRRTPIVGLAAVDAHARIGLDERTEPRAARTLLKQPSYETMFRTLVQGVWLDAPLSGDAAADSRRLLNALRGGRTFSLVRAFADPADFTVTQDATQVTASIAGADDADVIWLRNGEEVVRGRGQVSAPLVTPGHYRVEVRRPGARTPWIVSGGIHVPTVPQSVSEDAGRRANPPLLAATDTGASIDVPLSADTWTLEQHPGSTGETSVTATGAREFTYTLGPGRPGSQYAAVVYPIASESLETIRLTASASRPTRVSVQARLPHGPDGERWVRSVYLDTTPRTVTLRLADFSPAGVIIGRRPIAARVKDLLFVIDLTNANPGSTGRVWLHHIEVFGPAAGPATVTSGR